MARALRQVDDGLSPTEGPRTTGSRTRVFCFMIKRSHGQRCTPARTPTHSFLLDPPHPFKV